MGWHLLPIDAVVAAETPEYIAVRGKPSHKVSKDGASTPNSPSTSC